MDIRKGNLSNKLLKEIEKYRYTKSAHVALLIKGIKTSEC